MHLNRQVLAEFDLSPRRYVLMAARLVPEKRQTDLIRAFARRENKDVKLVVPQKFMSLRKACRVWS